MDIVAKVFDMDITTTELEFEESRIEKLYPDADKAEIKKLAFTQLVDRYLLTHEASTLCFSVNEDEYEIALLDMIDDFDTSETSLLVNREGRGEQIERIVKSDLLIKKYINSLDEVNYVSEDRLHKFYDERKDYFIKEKEVKASQIILKDATPENLEKIKKIRDSIKTTEDFKKALSAISESSKVENSGDLGFFPQGRMIPEIDEVAFSLKKNEISQPFKSQLGYHILMVTDIKEKKSIPFEEVKDSLKESLKGIGREVTLARIVTELRESCKDSIKIFDNDLK